MVVATLDAPIEAGNNVIWCASFQAAWKRLQNDLFEGPIRLIGAEALARALNNAPEPADDIPKEWLYAVAGWTKDGIVETIQREMVQRFPDKDAPDFPGAVGFVAYAYLAAALSFPEPYLQNDEPLFFTDSRGQQTAVSSFGIREKDGHAYQELRWQPAVLYANQDEDGELEFAIDLWFRSESIQLVVARLAPERTLASTLARVASWSANRSPFLGLDDVVLVPDMNWRIEHDFEEIATAIKGVAKQDIEFKLDRNGAQLSSEAKIYTFGAGGKPRHFVLDRPFLLYMKMRQAERPFLVMWVDNPDLLTPFVAEGGQT